MSEWVYATDIEGPKRNPKKDDAKGTTSKLKELGLITAEDEELIWEHFDSYDDNKFRDEQFLWSLLDSLHLAIRPRWSTGTTPGVAQWYAAIKGLTEKDLHKISVGENLSGLSENVGVPELHQALKDRGIEVVYLTSANASASLELGKKYVIPSSNIWSLGYRPSPEKLREFDEQKIAGVYEVMPELNERSIVNRLVPFKGEAEDWMPRFLNICKARNEAYKKGDRDTILKTENGYLKLFEDKKYSPGFLQLAKDSFLHQNVLMGSHQKAEVLFRLFRLGKRIIYVGDSIVDTGPMIVVNALGGYSIALDDSNEDTLLTATFSMCGYEDRVASREALVPVIDDIIVGKFSIEGTGQKVAKYGAQLFSTYDVHNDLSQVKGKQKAAKNYLKTQ